MKKVMKNSLFALLWAIALVPVCAQKTLPQHLQPYIENLNPKVVKAFKQTGFDLSANLSATPKTVAQNRSGELRLDSTISFYGYDFVGTDDTIPHLRTNYEYPLPTLEIQTELQYEIDEWAPLSRSNIYTDGQKRIVEVLSEAYDVAKGDFVPDSRVVIFPHGNSQDLVDSFFVYAIDSATMNWAVLFYSLNQFDAQDRLTESVTSFDYFGEIVLFKDVHSYDVNGDNTLIESFAIFDGIETPSGKSELEYLNHLPIQVVAFAPDGLGGYLPQTRITYAYTNFNKEAQVNSYEWDLGANDWIQTQGVIYGYDSALRQNSKETIIYHQGGLEERELARYDYIEAEKIATEAYYIWDGIYFLSDRKFYYYSDATLADKEPIQVALPLEVSPNPTAGLVRLKLDAPAVVRIYNTQGELVSSGNYQPNYTLTISDLPSGLYFITARSESRQYAGRLIKE